MNEKYWTPEAESWKPIEMRKSRFGRFRVLECRCSHSETCGPCLEDAATRRDA